MSESRVGRRFLAEGVLIIASILLAFWIDAWWSGRQEEARGYQFLAVLADDLRATIRNNQTFSSRARGPEEAVTHLVRAYHDPRLPPRDSLAAWFERASNWWVVQPSLGAAESLVASGDINLIPSDSVPAAVLTYLTIISEFERFEERGLDRFLAAVDELGRRVDLEGLRLARMSAAARDSSVSSNHMFPFPSGPLRYREGRNPEVLVLDDDVHRILENMRSAKLFMRGYRERMLRSSERLLAQVEAALAAR